MAFSKALFIAAGFVLLALGVAGIALPVLPTTPFLLAASFCFLKGSRRLYVWIMSNRFFGPRIERFHSAGLTAAEKISVYLFGCALIIPIIVLARSPHLRIFLIALLLIKGIVFLRMKTAPAAGKTAVIQISSVFPAAPEDVWPLLLRVETLRRVAAPYAAFSPADAAGDTLWREGAEIRFRLQVFGLPLGVHTIRIHAIDAAARTIRTFEGNKLAAVWNHTITLAPADAGSTLYTDTVEIGAGILTGAVRLWAGAFYRRRQKKWPELLANPANPD
jgi:uncharacterized membrane protein YbaN (DUF454 family)